MVEMADVDRVQTEAQITNLEATKQSLIAQDLDTSAIDAAIFELQALLAPEPEPEPQPPSSHVVPEYEDHKGCRWKLYFYAGGYYVKPPQDSIYWDEFVARYGQTGADAPAYETIADDSDDTA